jgi:hypothetical protein
MYILYNSKFNTFRTDEIWDIDKDILSYFSSYKIFKSFFDSILPNLKNGAKFIFDLSHEDCDVYNEFINRKYHYLDRKKDDYLKSDFLDWIYDYILENELDNSIQIWTGVLNIKKLIPKKYNKIVYPKIRFSNYPHKSTDYAFLNERKFDNRFSFVAGRLTAKPERVEIFNFFKNNNLLNDSTYAFNTIDIDSAYSTKYLEDISIGNKMRRNDKISYSRYGEMFFSKSFLHLTIESRWISYIHGMYGFISEKIFRPINSMNPFIVAAYPNFIKKLHELGFKTFDRWWDESYDMEEDDEKRLNMIFTLLKEISEKPMDELEKIYNEMIPILQHNFDLATNLHEHTDLATPYENAFDIFAGFDRVYIPLTTKINPNLSIKDDIKI